MFGGLKTFGRNLDALVCYDAFGDTMSYYCKSCPTIIEEDDIDECPPCRKHRKRVENRSLIRATPTHEAGAYGRCKYCGRYSDNIQCIVRSEIFVCDCGMVGGWKGLFDPPTSESRWIESDLRT